MRTHRPGGRAHARRPVHAAVFSLVTILSASSAARAADVTGTVVDQNGRPLPHATVRIVESADSDRPADAQPASTRTAREVFTDDGGRFVVPTVAGCRLEIVLAGFRTTTASCTDESLTIRMTLAPVEESVVVTATRTETPSGQTGLSTTTFTAADIERRQAPMVTDLLRTSPGAMVLQTGAPGGVTGLFVRGGESTYNTVLVDGIPVNEPGGTFNFNALTTENVERIEVVRGANSALFGSDAMSSVVQVFTKRGVAGTTSAPAVSAQVDGGSYGTVHASAAASGATGPLDYSFSAARFSTDNRVPNSGFDATTLSANVGRAFAGNAIVRAIVRTEFGRAGTPGQTAYGRPDLDASYDHHDATGGLSVDQQVTPAFHQRATYSLASSHQASTNLAADPPFTPSYDGRVAPFEWFDYAYDSRTALRRHYASYQADWHVVAHGGTVDQRLTGLVDWNGERARLDDHLTGDGVSASRDNVGVALQHQLLWRRLSTTVGTRLERNDSFGTALAPRGAAAVTLREGNGVFGDTRLHAAAGVGIKEPTVLQSFSTSPYFKGNPDLEPERARTVESGIEQRLASDHVRLDATWFDNRYRNIIALRSTGGATSEYFNIGLTRARGLELDADLQANRAVRIRGGYSFVDSEILESTSTFSPVLAAGQWAFRRPRHSGFVEGSWTRSALTADLTGVFIGRYVDSDFASLAPPLTENPGHSTWNGRLSYRFTPQVTGLLAIDNITDREYQEPLGYVALRRAGRVGVRVSF